MAYIPICSFCKTVGVRNEQYDSYYCPKCGQWLEQKCSDDKCEFCVNRPPEPPQAD